MSHKDMLRRITMDVLFPNLDKGIMSPITPEEVMYAFQQLGGAIEHNHIPRATFIRRWHTLHKKYVEKHKFVAATSAMTEKDLHKVGTFQFYFHPFERPHLS